MKKQIPTFLAGMLTMALVGSLGVGALAASGSFTITVDPINIQVNGVTFAPKNEKGEEVPVFAYDGTTYAPLRALAEAYGLEVGYDAQANMATVGEKTTTPEPEPTASPTDYSNWTAEEEAAYQEFKGMWEVEKLTYDAEYNIQWYRATYIGDLSKEEFDQKLNLWNATHSSDYAERFALEYYNPDAQMRFEFCRFGIVNGACNVRHIDDQIQIDTTF